MRSAAVCRVSKSTLSEYGNPRYGERHMPLDVVLALERFRAILGHLTAHQGPVGRRGLQVDVGHRPKTATPPRGLGEAFGVREAFGGAPKPFGCVAPLARCATSRYATRLPEWLGDAIKWVTIARNRSSSLSGL